MDKALIENILKPSNKKNQKANEKRVRKAFWQSLRKASAHIPFMEDVVAAYFCAFDPKTPKAVRATLLAALAYFVMPFDFVPDILAFIGFTDDIAVLTFTLATLRAHMKDVHYEAAKRVFSKEDFTKKK